MLALITGGSGSGKSAYAEALCVKLQEKKQDILETYAQAGVYLGKQLLEMKQ